MFIKQLRDAPTRNQYASLHVLFHGVPGQICAGDETHPAVGDGDFGVDAPIGERIGLVTPGIESCGWDQRFHLSYRIEGDATSVILGQLE